MCEKGRNETLHSLGDILLCDMEFLTACRRYSTTSQSKHDFTERLKHRRHSFINFYKAVKHNGDIIEPEQADSNDGTEVDVSGVEGGDSGVENGVNIKDSLPNIPTVQYKDMYEIDSDESDREGVVTITPFVDIRRVKVTSRGRTKLDDALRELKQRISKFEFERKFRKTPCSDDFQSFLGNTYLDMFDQRHGKPRIEPTETTESPRHDVNDMHRFLIHKTKDTDETINKSYALNAKIHALARSQQKDVGLPLTRSTSAIRLPPINAISLSADGYDSSPEVIKHHDEKHLISFNDRPARSACLRVPVLHTALRARKRFPQHERYQDLLHELRKLSNIVRQAEHNGDNHHYHST